MNLVILAIIGVLIFFLSAKRAAIRLAIQPQTPRNIRLENGRIAWIQPILVNNPTPTPIALQGIDLDVRYNGQRIGRANFIGSALFRSGDTVLNTNVFLLVSDTISVIPAAVRSGTIKLDFVGVIRTYGVNLPIDFEYGLTLPKLV